MLYMLGMSHAISVLRAIDGGVDDTHENWNVNPDLVEWRKHRAPENFRDVGFDTIKLLLIRPAMNWHTVLEKRAGGDVLSATPGFWSLLDSIPSSKEEDTLISFIGGNDHSVFSLVESSSPFDFRGIQDERYPLIHGRQPIDIKYVESQIEKLMNGTVAMLTALRLKHPRLRIVHVMPPPPIASEARIKAHPEVFGGVIERFGITPISVRMKVYLVYCALLTQVLDRLNALPIYPPTGATDGIGALKDEYAYGCTHGNEAYGQLVAEQLADALKESHASV